MQLFELLEFLPAEYFLCVRVLEVKVEQYEIRTLPHFGCLCTKYGLG